MEESYFTAETAKMQKWTEVAFTNYLKNGLSGDCWCFLKGLPLVFRAMLPVTSTPWSLALKQSSFMQRKKKNTCPLILPAMQAI